MAPCLSSYTKQRIVNLSKIYKSYTEIVRKLEEEEIRVSRQTISKIIKRFNHTGSLGTHTTNSGWKRSLCLEHANFIDAKMEENDEYTSVGKTDNSFSFPVFFLSFYLRSCSRDTFL